MRSPHVHALATLVTALPLLAAMPGCTFDPVGAVPGDGGPPPVDGSPIPPTDGSPVTPLDGSAPIDGPPVVEIDARENPQRRKQITILSARVEAPGASGSLTDFPVLFAVQDSEIAARASNDGRDIYFTDEDGDALAHEIEKWDRGTGQLVAWVKLPQLPEAEDTVFYVYYGDQAAAPTPAPAQVWTNGFAAVWHLSQQPGPADGIRDSASDNHGTPQASMQANDLVSAQIGDGIDFDGVDDEITFGNPITGSGPHTISVWVNQRATSSVDALVVLGDGQDNRARWFYSVYLDDDVAAGFYGNDVDVNVNIIGDGWTLLHWTYDSGDRDNVFYLNGGSPRIARTNSGVDTRGNTGRLGNADGAFGPNMNLNGQLDEVRISTVVRPAEWITTEFNNQSSPSTFYTVGPESVP